MVNDKGLRYWVFPQDYPGRIIDILDQAVATDKSR